MEVFLIHCCVRSPGRSNLTREYSQNLALNVVLLTRSRQLRHSSKLQAALYTSYFQGINSHSNVVLNYTVKFTLTKSHFNEDRFITKFFPERIHIFYIKRQFT